MTTYEFTLVLKGSPELTDDVADQLLRRAATTVRRGLAMAYSRSTSIGLAAPLRRPLHQPFPM
jgi:hypothetical protein